MGWARRGELMPEEYGAAVGRGKDPVAVTGRTAACKSFRLAPPMLRLTPAEGLRTKRAGVRLHVEHNVGSALARYGIGFSLLALIAAAALPRPRSFAMVRSATSVASPSHSGAVIGRRNVPEAHRRDSGARGAFMAPQQRTCASSSLSAPGRCGADTDDINDYSFRKERLVQLRA